MYQIIFEVDSNEMSERTRQIIETAREGRFAGVKPLAIKHEGADTFRQTDGQCVRPVIEPPCDKVIEDLSDEKLLEAAFAVKFYPLDWRNGALPLHQCVGLSNQEQIIQRLKGINRFSGAGWSVWKHSEAATSMVLREPGQLSTDFVRMQAAVRWHDAEEAFIGDIVRPVIDIMEIFGLRRELWNQFCLELNHRICSQFKLPGISAYPELVGACDNQAMREEISDLVKEAVK